MPLRGEIHRDDGQSDRFELPDPRPGEITLDRRQIRPNTWRHIVWAPSHMISTGARGSGRAYLKLDQVGAPLATANLPIKGAIDVLKDPDTGTIITVTRT